MQAERLYRVYNLARTLTISKAADSAHPGKDRRVCRALVYHWIFLDYFPKYVFNVISAI